MSVGERIRQLRESRGWTQEELGNKLGLQRAAINKYEKGRVENLKRSTIEQLCTIFDVTPQYLMGMDDMDTKDDIFYILQDALEILLDDSRTPRYAGKVVDDKTRQQMISMLNTLNDVMNINLF